MNKKTLRIATRKSPLALWQTQRVHDALLEIHPTLQIEILKITTQGDKILDTPLAKIGGKGLFIKELEISLLKKQADIAVHSMKDVPVETPDGLIFPVIMYRQHPHDALISNNYSQLTHLPTGAIIGTSSLRRQSQLLALRPDLQIHPLRGNIGTRLKKLDQGQYHAIILAAAGLHRLNLTTRIRQNLTPDIMLPAIGQGAIGIECRASDTETQSIIAPLNHIPTQKEVLAERAINQCLKGGCQQPIAGNAVTREDTITLQGLVGDATGKTIPRHAYKGKTINVVEVGMRLDISFLSNH
jgi:hydroxymethylbilane synthase